MPINVALRNTAYGWVTSEADAVFPERVLPYRDASFPLLRGIDPYGDTVFNRPQMPAVIEELERLIAAHPIPELRDVLDLARRAASEVRTYLVFIGD